MLIKDAYERFLLPIIGAVLVSFVTIIICIVFIIFVFVVYIVFAVAGDDKGASICESSITWFRKAYLGSKLDKAVERWLS